MDRKTLTIIFSVVLTGSFFLPFMLSGLSGYDAVFRSEGGSDSWSWERYIWLLIPVSAILLLVGALKKGNYIPGRGVLSWLPLLTLIYICVRIIMEVHISFGSLIKGLHYGFWISLAAALILAFYNPKPKA